MSDKTFLAVAIKALRHYSLENPRLTRLGGASNINFKVDKASKVQFIIRHILVGGRAAHNRSIYTSTFLNR